MAESVAEIHLRSDNQIGMARRPGVKMVNARSFIERGSDRPGRARLQMSSFDYVADWVLDDQPVRLKTRGRPIVSVPYSQECNDVAMMLIQHQVAAEYRSRAIDQFDQIYKDSVNSARIMALVVHPYIMGAPHRLRYFREALEHMRERSDVLFWTGERIHDWYVEASP